jgi:hypothetical protein
MRVPMEAVRHTTYERSIVYDIARPGRIRGGVRGDAFDLMAGARRWPRRRQTGRKKCEPTISAVVSLGETGGV